MPRPFFSLASPLTRAAACFAMMLLAGSILVNSIGCKNQASNGGGEGAEQW